MGHRAQARRLFRDGDDRDRPGLLLYRLPVELADGRRRRLARLLAPAARLRPVQDRHSLEFRGLLLFRARLLRRDRGDHELHPAFAVRAHLDRHPGERASRAISWATGRAPHLARVHAVVLLHGLRRRALFASEQFRRSARPALQPIRRFRHDGRDGGHAQFLGPLLGAAVFVVLQDYLSSVTVNWMSGVGVLFVLIVLFFPRGLLGFITRKGQA